MSGLKAPSKEGRPPKNSSKMHVEVSVRVRPYMEEIDSVTSKPRVGDGGSLRSYREKGNLVVKKGEKMIVLENEGKEGRLFHFNQVNEIETERGMMSFLKNLDILKILKS